MMTYLELGDAMIGAWDHDYSHKAIHDAPFTREEKERVVMAYRWFMHLGTACFLASASTPEEFWWRLDAEYDTLPRKIDRHQTRGEQGRKTINFIRHKVSDPKDGLDLVVPKGMDFGNSYMTLISVPGWGPSNAWHTYDMIERTLPWRGNPGVSMADARQYMYDYPWGALAEIAVNGETPHQVADRVQKELAWMPAPPTGNRPVNMQEIESLLCRYRKMLKGRYYVGKDRETVIKNLKWRASPLAERMLEATEKAFREAGGRAW